MGAQRVASAIHVYSFHIPNGVDVAAFYLHRSEPNYPKVVPETAFDIEDGCEKSRRNGGSSWI